MQLLTLVVAYIMASWPPLSHKNLINRIKVFRYCKLTIPVWVDTVDKRYFRYTAQPSLYVQYATFNSIFTTHW